MKTQYWYWIWRTFLGPSRLRKKFVRSFLMAGLIPLLLMGTVSVYVINLTHSIDVEALERNLANQVALEIKKNIDGLLSELKLRVAFEEFAPVQFTQQDALLENILRNNASLVEASFVCLTPQACVVGKETRRWTKGKTDPEPSQEMRNQNGSVEFQNAEKGNDYVSPARLENGSFRITLAAPNYNRKQEIISVAIGKINLDQILGIANSNTLGATGYVYITDEENKVVAYPKSRFLGRDTSELPTVRSAKSTEANIDKRLVYKNFDGETVSGSAVVIPSLGWTVVVEWPRAETQTLIRTILLQVGGFAVLTLFVIIIMASWVAFKLIQPIAELRQGTNIIGAGDFKYRVQIKTGDELEDLGANLNKMAASLKGLEELHELKIRTDALAESLRKEQELSKLKDQFITTISHQLNTPLSVISWAVAALKEKNVPPEKFPENLDIISKSQKDIAAIVNDLVTLSEVGFRYQKTKTKQVDLAALIEKTLERFQGAVKLKRLSISFTNKARNPIAEANEFTITKALENLIDNAIAYSHDGGQIAIELDSTEREIVFTIADQGIGIPKTDQPSIFQQFFRAKNSVTKKNVGTGLGLFITKTIVEGHGGKITFESEENKGSKFSFAIPR